MKALLPLILISSMAYANESHEELVQGCRQSIIKMSQKNKFLIFSPIQRNDLAEELIDEPRKMVRRPQDMEINNLVSGRAKNIPWSDSYWPIYRGGLGQRYNDPEFSPYDWKEANEYIKAKPAAALIRDGKLDSLSPSEKYDHLLGLSNFPLTASQWTDGLRHFARSGRVESWMGFCHGWAPASMMMLEPKKKLSLDGMTLFPSDIKGLSTLTWAKGNFPIRFIGGRCNTKHPHTDEHDRTVEQSCLDNNPGSWHMVVVNQLGISQRPFIMDASYDYQVWNHPVYAYQYVYFNPKTKEDGNFSSSVEQAGSWDNRKQFRSVNTKTIVGVRMSVTFAVENEPSPDEDQTLDSSSTVYEYDLELNQQGEIIGGEWHSHGHPDFLWVPVPGAYPQTVGDQLPLSLQNLSPEVKKAAQIGAQSGLPMGNLVKALVQLSANEN